MPEILPQTTPGFSIAQTPFLKQKTSKAIDFECLANRQTYRLSWNIPLALKQLLFRLTSSCFVPSGVILNTTVLNQEFEVFFHFAVLQKAKQE
jgi:hypothetical protein